MVSSDFESELNSCESREDQACWTEANKSAVGDFEYNFNSKKMERPLKSAI